LLCSDLNYFANPTPTTCPPASQAWQASANLREPSRTSTDLSRWPFPKVREGQC